ncbi:hypothetical protein ACWD7C_36855 [Streptomyces sp. NPDC005134]|uniref:hypothetical protein n=1 Tax=unclassified Streptomyces TaxID=2593676 RepID=UPI0033AD4EDB
MALLDWLLVTRLFTAKAAWFEGAVLTVTILLALAILRGMFTSCEQGALARYRTEQRSSRTTSPSCGNRSGPPPRRQGNGRRTTCTWLLR